MRTNKLMFQLIREKTSKGLSRKLLYREALDIFLSFLEGNLIEEPKKLSMAEHRKKFESLYSQQLGFSHTLDNRGLYTDNQLRYRWFGYIGFARENNLIKDGE